MQITFRLPAIVVMIFLVGQSFAYPITPLDRTPVKKHTKATFLTPPQEKKYITGPRGGCYYINKNGNKNYVDRSYCGGSSVPRNKIKADVVSSTTPAARNYIRGPRGGCYYINKSGRKIYVGSEMCE